MAAYFSLVYHFPHPNLLLKFDRLVEIRVAVFTIKMFLCLQSWEFGIQEILLSEWLKLKIISDRPSYPKFSFVYLNMIHPVLERKFTHIFLNNVFIGFCMKLHMQKSYINRLKYSSDEIIKTWIQNSFHRWICLFLRY